MGTDFGITAAIVPSGALRAGRPLIAISKGLRGNAATANGAEAAVVSGKSMSSGLFAAPDLSPHAVLQEWNAMDHALDGTTNESTRHIQQLRNRMQGVCQGAQLCEKFKTDTAVVAGLDPRCQAMKLNMSFKRIPFMRHAPFLLPSQQQRHRLDALFATGGSPSQWCKWHSDTPRTSSRRHIAARAAPQPQVPLAAPPSSHT